MHSVRRQFRRIWLAVPLAILMTAVAFPLRDLIAARARHEIPASVTVLAFLKPENDRLHLLLRVPLESMRDFEFPLRDSVYLEISRAEALLRPATRLWLTNYLTLFEENERLSVDSIVAARISMPGDKSFSSYETARAHFDEPVLPDSVMIPWKQASMDVLLVYRIRSPESDFSVDPELAHLGVRTSTVLRFIPFGGKERVLQYSGNPGLIRLDPSWVQAAFLFIRLGFQHILGGLDHLLFLFCLVIPFRRVKPLIIIVSAFTVAHSITLAAAALNFAPTALWFGPLIETLIALSILFLALENIIGVRVQRRWLVAFIFGLVHGFGFSFFLRESLQFGGSHLAASLVSFNIGVELGQLLMIAITVPLLALLFRYVVAARMGTIILSAFVAHTAWHWMIARGGELVQYDFTIPAVDGALLVSAMRWTMLLLILAGVIWLLTGWAGRSRAEMEETLTTTAKIRRVRSEE
jgi:hypothetical protein